MSQPLALALAGVSTTPRPQATRTDALVKSALVLGGALLTAVAAQVTIPWQPVPFTLQTLALLLCGLGLGARLGAGSQILYVLIGVFGAPVFAGHSHGFLVLVGPTAGYLWSYPIASFLLGKAAEKGWGRNPLKLSLVMAAALTLILGMGWAWLAIQEGPAQAFADGVAPFLLIEVAKGLVATGLLPAAWLLLGKYAKGGV
jgi:biotin transport system substrate-specific component